MVVVVWALVTTRFRGAGLKPLGFWVNMRDMKG